MLIEMLCAIPEAVGWAIVGGMAVITAQVGWAAGKLIYQHAREDIQERKVMAERANAPDGEWQ